MTGTDHSSRKGMLEWMTDGLQRALDCGMLTFVRNRRQRYDMISPTETLILSLLMQHHRGAYASELLHSSDGRLKRGSVYTTLNRMEDAGLVSSKEEEPTEAYALPRTRYTVTGSGIRAREEFASFTGLPLSGVQA